jgi:hypothetical protein
LLTDLSTAGNLPVPADSPPSNKREREESDEESPQTPPPSHHPTHQPRRSVLIGSAPYPPVAKAQGDVSSIHPSAGPGAEFTSLPTMSPTAATTQGIQPNVFGQSVPAPPNKVASMLVPQPYNGSYRSLGGSSGLGQASPAIESSAPMTAPVYTSFGSTSQQSGTATFSPPSTMYDNNNNRPLPLSTGPGRAPAPGTRLIATKNGLYDLNTSTPPLASASASSVSSPQSGFHPGTDFNASAGGGVFDMSGMDMEFGGYGVPTADKEAMLRQFAPALLQDGQIGVDRDTMMMWTTMPSTYECVSSTFCFCDEAHTVRGRTQDWETYLTSMLGLGTNTAADPGAGAGVDARGMGRAL